MNSSRTFWLNTFTLAKKLLTVGLNSAMKNLFVVIRGMRTDFALEKCAVEKTWGEDPLV